MHKMFGDRPIPGLLETWLESAAVCIDSYGVFPDTQVMFFEELGPESIARCGALLGLQIEIPPGKLDRGCVQSKLSDDLVPPQLQPYADLYSGCSEIYRELRDNFCPESRRYCGTQSNLDFFRQSACQHFGPTRPRGGASAVNGGIIHLTRIRGRSARHGASPLRRRKRLSPPRGQLASPPLLADDRESYSSIGSWKPLPTTLEFTQQRQARQDAS